MIKVRDFIGSQINTDFAGKDLYVLTSELRVDVFTDEGALHYTMKPGFLTNMRSGGHCIDWFIPKFTGNKLYNLAIICHDFAYTKLPSGQNPISKELADELLRQMVIMSGQLSRAKAYVMWKILDALGASSYESENTGDYAGIEKYMEFEWSHKQQEKRLWT
jgi:hypothetical protein